MKNSVYASLLITVSFSISGMLEITKGVPISETTDINQLLLDDNKEFTPQIFTYYKVPQPLLDALQNSKNKKALRYLGLRLYNRRAAPLNSEGKGDFLDFSILENMKRSVSLTPSEVNVQNLAHWLSRKPIPIGLEPLKTQAFSQGIDSKYNKTIHSTISHSDRLGDFCEIIFTHINRIAQNDDWTPAKTEMVMKEFINIYLNIKSSSIPSSSDTTTKGK